MYMQGAFSFASHRESNIITTTPPSREIEILFPAAAPGKGTVDDVALALTPSVVEAVVKLGGLVRPPVAVTMPVRVKTPVAERTFVML
jgi:hypothetical protein